MNLQAPTAAPSLPPCPAGMGDWFDSSRELQCGLQVTEWHLPEWEALASLGAVPAQPTTH